MEYITHKRFKGMALCGRVLNLPYGTELVLEGEIIKTLSGDAVCAVTSENAKMHFARNNDGKGLQRGKITYDIAFKKNGNGYRLTEKQRDIINRHYQRFIRDDCDFIIFNDRFFGAAIDELEEMAAELKVAV